MFETSRSLAHLFCKSVVSNFQLLFSTMKARLRCLYVRTLVLLPLLLDSIFRKIFSILPLETLNSKLFSGILPICPVKTHMYCPADSSGRKSCISRAQLCDFTDDCWDGSDEVDCDNYTRCDFNDTGLCGWVQAKNDQMNWTRHSGSTSSIYTGKK